MFENQSGVVCIDVVLLWVKIQEFVHAVYAGITLTLPTPHSHIPIAGPSGLIPGGDGGVPPKPRDSSDDDVYDDQSPAPIAALQHRRKHCQHRLRRSDLPVQEHLYGGGRVGRWAFRPV